MTPLRSLTQQANASSQVRQLAIPPVIILGMHRSGTTLVTRLLQEAGLFVGAQPNAHRESRFFMGVNDWLLSRCGATWENPCGIDVLDDFPEARRVLSCQLRRSLGSPMARHYLGRFAWTRYRNGRWLPFAWGWKDPRNTFTTPLWLELFPEAKLINVERHGIDVALSLKHRVERNTALAVSAIKAQEETSRPVLSKNQLLDIKGGLKFRDLHEGIELWAAYARRAREHCQVAGSRAFTVHFEDLLADPQRGLEELFKFVGLAHPPKASASLAGQLNGSRAFAWKAKQDPELTRLDEEHRGLLSEFGY